MHLAEMAYVESFGALVRTATAAGLLNRPRPRPMLPCVLVLPRNDAP